MVTLQTLESQTEQSTMSEFQARRCIENIRDRLGDLRRLVLKLWDEKGYLALGYESFKACIDGEFSDKNASYIYRIKDAATLERNLRVLEFQRRQIHGQKQDSPMGESSATNNPPALPVESTLPPDKNTSESHSAPSESVLPDDPIPERQLRELSSLETPEQQLDAYTEATQNAKTDGKSAVTTAYIQAAAKKIKDTEDAERYPVIATMLDFGDITPSTGAAITRELDKLEGKPQVLSQMVELIGSWGLHCPALIPKLAEKMDRPPSKKPSKVWETFLATGYLGGVPLKDATLTDLENANQEAQKEHIAEAIEAKRKTQSVESQRVSMLGDTLNMQIMKTELERHIAPDRLQALAQMMMEQRVMTALSNPHAPMCWWL